MRHLPWPWLLASECGKSSNELSRKEGKGQNCNKGCKFWGSHHPKGVKIEVDLGKWISRRFKRLFMAIFVEICNPEKDLHLHQRYQKLTSNSKLLLGIELWYYLNSALNWSWIGTDFQEMVRILTSLWL